MYLFLLFLIVPFFFVSDCFAVVPEWTPLITSAYFTGIQVDLGTAVSGIVALLFIILGLSILYRVLGR
ncbi:MAG: hypothetical protein D3914_00710 [Candidatus Electrothrix sp. LOE2]|nr:hypothetical protein [Candidatus Electrothrix sp. LOE2]